MTVSGSRPTVLLAITDDHANSGAKCGNQMRSGATKLNRPRNLQSPWMTPRTSALTVC